MNNKPTKKSYTAAWIAILGFILGSLLYGLLVIAALVCLILFCTGVI